MHKKTMERCVVNWQAELPGHGSLKSILTFNAISKRRGSEVDFLGIEFILIKK
jgi:hypothetical protein